MITPIQSQVENAFRASRTPFDATFFEQHVVVMADFADRLAQRLVADHKLVALGAWLHDLGVLSDASDLASCIANHADNSARITGELLDGQSLSKDEIQLIQTAIRNHSAPNNGNAIEVCISHADALAQIARPLYWLHYGTRVRGLDFNASLAWLRDRTQAQWPKLHPEAQAIIRPEYDRAMELFRS